MRERRAEKGGRESEGERKRERNERENRVGKVAERVRAREGERETEGRKTRRRVARKALFLFDWPRLVYLVTSGAILYKRNTRRRQLPYLHSSRL